MKLISRRLIRAIKKLPGRKKWPETVVKNIMKAKVRLNM